MSPSAPEAFLDPKLLGQIGDLALLARVVVDGFVHGLHRSMRAGVSIDFAEHRPYQPGDDLRRIDWRVYGRTERFYMKTYEADTNADVIFALDASGSMDYGQDTVTKFDYARFLVASLAWLAVRQGDRVGLVTMSSEDVEIIPPSGRHLNLLLHSIARTKATGVGKIPEMMERVGRLNGVRPGMIVLASDCYEEPAELRRVLGGLRARGHDVLVFHLLDAAERDLPWSAPGNFEDAETGARMPLRPDDLRDSYRKLMDEHRLELTREFGLAGVDYSLLETDRPLDAALRTFLDRRMLGSRSR